MDEDRIETRAVHGGERRPGPEGSVVYPIYQGTVYSVPSGTDYHDLRYIRLNSTPSQSYLHDKLAALEGAEAGLATASGMAAITTALHSVLRSGDHLLVGDCLYGGTHDFLTQHAADFGWTFTFIDPHRPETWEAALTAKTKAVLVESITNPLVRVGRLPEVAAFARANGLVSLIDNTFATPVNFRPVTAGFDLVLHSATKYLNGHSDIVAGAVVGDAEHVERARTTSNHFGGTLDPHAGFLLARGLKTLALRVRAQNENALRLAEFLADRPEVAEVNHPGLASHPDHQRASELFDGFGGMLSIRPAGGVSAAQKLIDAVRLPFDAPSLGGVESLITRPAATSHAGMSPQDRLALGVTDDLVRISVGVESPEDLVADFEQALGTL
ncbi:aminotransferase class I/II-fold pyridoxal phosphate-dependent enzyme [Saccharopolyspora rhizosphaerae]|uniref:homocysteine desulfhydrase n=1 Tax=Saccharopolyspora rhizosphaerae TaxID=2492662 RepID=A0A3R8P5Y5_9PSEU|nr:aminotransferase class I/II-fold pyridoxal phosphate-dependent enzyme [Saccharopolyspora rhizosphaerae]RRO17242.1 aminotransferase class I/II-fold pyridoxal phosphate-dependent enzyme [Saccharopolyspora rhizosphaerae]